MPSNSRILSILLQFVAISFLIYVYFLPMGLLPLFQDLPLPNTPTLDSPDTSIPLPPTNQTRFYLKQWAILASVPSILTAIGMVAAVYAVQLVNIIRLVLWTSYLVTLMAFLWKARSPAVFHIDFGDPTLLAVVTHPTLVLLYVLLALYLIAGWRVEYTFYDLLTGYMMHEVDDAGCAQPGSEFLPEAVVSESWGWLQKARAVWDQISWFRLGRSTMGNSRATTVSNNEGHNLAHLAPQKRRKSNMDIMSPSADLEGLPLLEWDPYFAEV